MKNRWSTATSATPTIPKRACRCIIIRCYLCALFIIVILSYLHFTSLCVGIYAPIAYYLVKTIEARRYFSAHPRPTATTPDPTLPPAPENHHRYCTLAGSRSSAAFPRAGVYIRRKSRSAAACANNPKNCSDFFVVASPHPFISSHCNFIVIGRAAALSSNGRNGKIHKLF